MSDNVKKQRTHQQNNALHLYFTHLAEELNNAGLDMRATLKPEIAIPWTATNIKEFLWRPVQQAQLGKKSTKDLTTSDIDKIYDTLNLHLGEKFGLHVPFPSEQELMFQMEQKIKTRKARR